MLSASVTHPTAIIACARCYSKMDYIAQVALKKKILCVFDVFKMPFWSSSIEKNNQVHKGPYNVAVVLSIHEVREFFLKLYV